MNKLFWKYILTAVLFATAGFLSMAQHYPDTLLKYMEIAAENNPAVQQKFTEYQAALEKIPQAGSLPDPELSIGVFLMPMELVNGRQMTDMTLMQMFPWFGVLRNAKDEMSLMANAKYEEFRDAKLQVFYELGQTWNELHRIKKDIRISEKNIGILNIIEDLALIRFKSAPSSVSGGSTQGSRSMPSGSSSNQGTGTSSGMPGMNGGETSGVSPTRPASGMQDGMTGQGGAGTGLSDLYRIQIEAADLENSIALLKDQERTIQARFNSYLNRAPEKPVFTADTLTADSIGIPQENFLDSIKANNPMLSMLEFERQSYLARKKMSKRMGLPMVGLGLNYSVIAANEMDDGMTASPMDGRDMIMPMVTVTLPVYRKKYKAMQKEAELMSQSASQNYQATSNTLQNEYFQAMQMYHDAKRRIKQNEEQFLLASRTLDLVLKSFSTSAAGLTDVLRVQQQTYDYELNRTRAVADLNTAVAMLRRLMSLKGTN